MMPIKHFRRAVWVGFGALSVVFHLWLIFSGLVPNLVSRPLHMALVIPWIFLYKVSSGIQRLCDWGIVIIGVSACLWLAINHQQLLDQYGFLATSFQTVIAITLLLIVLEMARRSIGWAIAGPCGYGASLWPFRPACSGGIWPPRHAVSQFFGNYDDC